MSKKDRLYGIITNLKRNNHVSEKDIDFLDNTSCELAGIAEGSLYYFHRLHKSMTPEDREKIPQELRSGINIHLQHIRRFFEDRESDTCEKSNEPQQTT